MIRILMAAVAALLVVSCSSDPATVEPDEEISVDEDITVERDMPGWIEVSLSSPAGAGVDENRNLVIVTMGSSSNPLRVTSLVAQGQTITPAIENEEDQLSTMDLAPTTSTVALPETTSADEPITVDLGDWGSVVIEPGPRSFTWVDVPDHD